MTEDEKKHGQQLFAAFVASTENLATGMLALGERLELANQLQYQALEESRLRREQDAALQRQIGVLVQVISQQKGIPVGPVPDPGNPLHNLINGAIDGIVNYRPPNRPFNPRG